MESKIAKHLCISNQPVAVIWADKIPKEAVHLKEDRWGCVVALIKTASQGKIAAALPPPPCAVAVRQDWDSNAMSKA